MASDNQSGSYDRARSLASQLVAWTTVPFAVLGVLTAVVVDPAPLLLAPGVLALGLATCWYARPSRPMRRAEDWALWRLEQYESWRRRSTSVPELAEQMYAASVTMAYIPGVFLTAMGVVALLGGQLAARI